MYDWKYYRKWKRKKLEIYIDKIIKPTNIKNHFKRLTKLKKVDFNGLVDFSETTDLSELFLNCIRLQEVNFGKTNFTKLEVASSMFKTCKRLKKIDGFDFNCPNLKDSLEFFMECFKLEAVDFSNANLEKLQLANHMFYACETIKEIDMSKVCLDNIVHLTSCFENCFNLETVKIKRISNVKNTESMFKDCEKLISIDIDFDYSKIQNACSMFASCRSLEHFNFSKFKPENAIDISFMFYNCNNLSGEAIFPEFEYAGSDMSYLFHHCGKITKIDMSKVKMNSIKKIARFAVNCQNLKSIEMGEGNLELGQLDMNLFATDSENLKYIDLQNIKTRGNLYLTEFAKDCTNLEVVKLGFPTSAWNKAISMFTNCISLKVLQYPIDKGVRYEYNLMDTFDGCKNIRSLNLYNIKVCDEIKYNLIPQNIKLLYVNEEDKKRIEENKEITEKTKNIIISTFHV